MLTLNEIVKLITDVGTDHDQIAETGVGDLSEWNPKDRNYPLLWVHYVDSNTEDAKLDMTFRVGCFDRVIMGEEGEDTEGHEQEVLSDTQLILLDVVAYFVQGNTDYFSTRITNLTPATERTDDRLTGHFVDLTISQDWDFNKCQIPATFGTPASIVDGLTLYDFCDSSVFDRLTTAQKACLTTELCGVADPATVKLNGTTIGTAPSGGELDTPVLQDAAPVGSLVGSDWIIPSCPAAALAATITIDDTTPTAFQDVTLNCVESGYDSYTWLITRESGVTGLQTFPSHYTLTGQSVQLSANWNGRWIVSLMVVSGASKGFSTSSFTVGDGMYKPTWTNLNANVYGVNTHMNVNTDLYSNNFNHTITKGVRMLTYGGTMTTASPSGISFCLTSLDANYGRIGLGNIIDDTAYLDEPRDFAINFTYNQLKIYDNGSPINIGAYTGDTVWRIHCEPDGSGDLDVTLFKNEVLSHTFSNKLTGAVIPKMYRFGDDNISIEVIAYGQLV